MKLVPTLTRLAIAAMLAGPMALAPAHADDQAKAGETATADQTGKNIADAFYGASFKNLKDNMGSMDQFKGKVVVMYFWATWCVPCRVETPNLVKLNETYKSKNKDVVVVGLALDNGDKVRQFVKDNNLTYPIFYGGHDAIALGKDMGNDQGAIPFTVVIGKDGKLIHTFKGDIPNSELEKIIDPLVG